MTCICPATLVYNHGIQPVGKVFHPYFVVAEDFAEIVLLFFVTINVVPFHEDT
jgi:hypothetical protein